MRKMRKLKKTRWLLAVMVLCCIWSSGGWQGADVVKADFSYKAYDYILPGSSNYYLTESEIADMSLQVLCYARNEIYARHGRKFDSYELQNYFNQQSWYYGCVEPWAFQNSVLNQYETANVELLKNREFTLSSSGYVLDQRGYSYQPIYDYLYGSALSDTYVFAGSDTRYISLSEINSMTLQEICYAKNEIYARHGRLFDSQELTDFFATKSWYYGYISPSKFQSSVLNTYEVANIELLKNNEFARSSKGYVLDQPGYNIYAVGEYGSKDSTYIFYDSNSRYLTSADVRYLSLQQVCYAKNEIYARRGRLFDSTELQNYFNQKTWYYGYISPQNFDSSVFNIYETANIEFLKNYEFSLDPRGYQLD